MSIDPHNFILGTLTKIAIPSKISPSLGYSGHTNDRGGELWILRLV